MSLKGTLHRRASHQRVIKRPFSWKTIALGYINWARGGLIFLHAQMEVVILVQVTAQIFTLPPLTNKRTLPIFFYDIPRICFRLKLANAPFLLLKVRNACSYPKYIVFSVSYVDLPTTFLTQQLTVIVNCLCCCGRSRNRYIFSYKEYLNYKKIAVHFASSSCILAFWIDHLHGHAEKCTVYI